jgi:hypothetical protein
MIKYLQVSICFYIFQTYTDYFVAEISHMVR